MKRTKKPTKKQTKTAKKEAPTSIQSIASRKVAEHFLIGEVVAAIDNSIYMHGIEPIDAECYDALQLEAIEPYRLEALMLDVYQALDRYFDRDVEDMEMLRSLSEVIQEEFDSYADDIIHFFWDADFDDEFFKVVGKNQYETDELGRRVNASSVLHGQVSSPITHLTEEESNTISEVMNKTLAAEFKKIEAQRAGQDEASDEQEEPAEKKSGLGQLALFGVAGAIGAGIVNAMAGSSGSGMRVSEPAVESANEVIDAVNEAVK
jgi:hypothetical protein